MTTYQDPFSQAAIDAYRPSVSTFQPAPAAAAAAAAAQPIAAPGPTPTYYAGSGIHAAQELKSRLEVGILGFLGYRAGKNHYELHHDMEEAVIYGAHAVRRWWVWLVFTKIWLFSAGFSLFMVYLRLHDNGTPNSQDFILNDGDAHVVTRNALIFLIPSFVLGVLVTYTRNIDYSLFKRRAFYWLLRPLSILVTWIPNWVLYLTVLCVLCFPI